MGATGTALIDFGSYPGGSDASLVITGQGAIISGSLVEAWILPANTTDHTADEHVVDPPRCIAGNVIAATGFTIYLVNEDKCYGIDGINGGKGIGKTVPNSNNAMCYGVWQVAWVWS